MSVMNNGAMRSGGGGAAALATSTLQLSLAEEWTDPGRQTDSDRQAERC
jgi:hypothetical protein